jgi:hypothetical protein
MKTVYVVMVGEFPTAATPSLELAQAYALAAESQHQKAGEWEHRWDEHHHGVLRLMQRRTARGGRFSWTQRSVRHIDYITEESTR